VENLDVETNVVKNATRRVGSPLDVKIRSLALHGFPVRLNSDGSTLAVGALDGNRFTVYKT